MDDTCLVTGAGGFLGSALCRRLLAEGYAIRGLDLRFPPEQERQSERLQGDVTDAGLLAQGCQGASFVFHLAALLPQRNAPPEEMRRVNVEGARAVLRAAADAGVRRLVLMSSAEVYGVPRQVPCPETARLSPIGEYGRNKVEAERLAREAMDGGLPAVILRPPTIVGPGMPEKFLRRTLAALRRGRPIFVPGGRIRFQMVAVSDAAEACWLAATVPGADGGTFNIGSDNVPTLLEMTRRLKRRLGSRSPIVPVPPALARWVFRLLLAVGRSPLEPEHVRIAFSDYVFDNARAKQTLHWQPRLDNVEALALSAAAR